nr:MAG TPA: hypothetical protein [Bacteriophage sp.]
MTVSHFKLTNSQPSIPARSASIPFLFQICFYQIFNIFRFIHIVF